MFVVEACPLLLLTTTRLLRLLVRDATLRAARCIPSDPPVRPHKENKARTALQPPAVPGGLPLSPAAWCSVPATLLLPSFLGHLQPVARSPHTAPPASEGFESCEGFGVTAIISASIRYVDDNLLQSLRPSVHTSCVPYSRSWAT